jgi:hypothetical protein
MLAVVAVVMLPMALIMLETVVAHRVLQHMAVVLVAEHTQATQV